MKIIQCHQRMAANHCTLPAGVLDIRKQVGRNFRLLLAEYWAEGCLPSLECWSTHYHRRWLSYTDGQRHHDSRRSHIECAPPNGKALHPMGTPHLPGSTGNLQDPALSQYHSFLRGEDTRLSKFRGS